MSRVLVEGRTFLPCPFCGSGRIGSHHIRDGRAVDCRDCGASVCAFNPNARVVATEKWNRRAAPANVEVAA